MIRNLIISGGSTKSIAVLGGLKVLEELYLLDDVKNFIGTSAGSIICFALVLGFSVDEALVFLKGNFILNKFHDLDLDELVSFNIFETYGFDSGKNIIGFLQNALFLKLKVKDMSFIELTKTTGKNLVVGVANITKQQSEHFSVDTTPELSIIQAIRMSISLPFVFTPVLYKESYYVDGGIYESFPTSYLEKFKDPLKDTLGICTSSQSKNNVITNILDYVTVLFGSIVDKANEVAVTNAKIKTIEIAIEEQDTFGVSLTNMNFDITEDLINTYFQKGYELVTQHFASQT